MFCVHINRITGFIVQNLLARCAPLAKSYNLIFKTYVLLKVFTWNFELLYLKKSAEFTSSKTIVITKRSPEKDVSVVWD